MNELQDPCPVCGSNEAGFGSCPEDKEHLKHSDAYQEPINCPCCDECRKKCLT